MTALRPETEDDLASILRDATQPLRIVGGGTRGLAPAAGETLETTGLNGISLYEPGALTLVVQAGTPLREIETVLAAENQRLAFEPMDHRRVLGTEGEPTIGGVVAANVSGPRRVSVGACRDFMLGVRFVDGAGTVIKNGGRVMKNVTGYDLVKLMTGSHGTLGVLSEVSLKVLPSVAATATLVLRDLPPEVAVTAMSTALGTPFEITGAAHTADNRTCLRLEGFETSVDYRVGRLREVLNGFGAVSVETDPEVNATLWRDIRDIAGFADHEVIWKISVKPSDSPKLIEELAKDFDFDTALDWGGGLLWLAVADQQRGADGSVQGTPDLHRAVQEGVARHGGHATLMKAADDDLASLSRFQPAVAPLRAIAHGLRAKFDPRGILNPGVMT